MELSQLRHFHAVVVHGKVGEAARAEGIAQPALTQSVRRLERDLGCPLVERAGRGVRVTEAGLLFDRRIAGALEEIDAARDEVRRFAAGEERTVRVSIGAASGLMAEAIARFRAERPDGRFEIRHFDAGARCDVRSLTRAQGAGPAASGTRAVFTERIMAALPRQMHERLVAEGRLQSGAIPVAELADAPFLTMSSSVGFRGVCDVACARAGFAPSIACESDNPATVERMISLGLGVGFWPEHSWGSVGESCRLVPIDGEGFARDIVVELLEAGREPSCAFFACACRTIAAAFDAPERGRTGVETPGGAVRSAR